MCVAADHEEIAAYVRAFGGEVQMTSPDCASGTDRVAEVAGRTPDVDIFVNVQGDEPELRGESIDLAIRLLADDPRAVMSTLATPIRRREQLEDPACVKVVFDQRGRALYFSRAAIPQAREWRDELLVAEPAAFLSAHRPVRLSPRLSLATGGAATDAAGKTREPRTTAGARVGTRDRGGGDRRANHRHRHAGRLRGVCPANEAISSSYHSPSGRGYGVRGFTAVATCHAPHPALSQGEG